MSKSTKWEWGTNDLELLFQIVCGQKRFSLMDETNKNRIVIANSSSIIDFRGYGKVVFDGYLWI